MTAVGKHWCEALTSHEQIFPCALCMGPMLARADPSAIYTSGGTGERKMLRTRSKCTISGFRFGSGIPRVWMYDPRAGDGSKWPAHVKVSGQQRGKESRSVAA